MVERVELERNSFLAKCTNPGPNSATPGLSHVFKVVPGSLFNFSEAALEVSVVSLFVVHVIALC